MNRSICVLLSSVFAVTAQKKNNTAAYVKWVAMAALFAAAPAGADPVQFEDTSAQLGFERGTETWGIAWGNLNGDKYPDLWNSGHRDFTRLYRNSGTGDFEDVAAEYDAQMQDWWMILTQRDVHGGAWGDFDKDGDDDLIVGDEDEFFTNHADSGGYFELGFTTTRQAFSAWIPSSDGTTLVSETRCDGNYVQLIDLDNDGDLDKICADADVFPESRSDAEADLVPAIGNVSDTIVGDFNNDLRQDIIAIRGALHSIGASKVDDTSIDAWFREGAGAQFTFAAQGKVTFLVDGRGGGAYLQADKLELDTAGDRSGEARGIEISYNPDSGLWTVLDNSDDEDKDQHYIRVRAQNPVGTPTMTGQTNRDLPAGMMHAVNNGNGFDWVYNTGLTTPVQCNSITTADFDNDMDLDLYVACGIGVENTANLYYDNDGTGRFSLVSMHGGEGPVGAGYDFGVAESVAAADYDVDGFVDLAVTNGILFYPFGFGGPDTLLRNRGNANHWIELDLTGVRSNGNGMGAKVYVTAGGVTQLREQNGGYHRWSQDHQRIHVGLAGHDTVDEIRIEWPSGAVDTYTDVAADALYDAVEETGLQLAVLGPPVTTQVNDGDECGIPAYRISYGPMIQLWRDCGTDDWHLRMESGLGRMTEFQPLTVQGTIVGNTTFAATSAKNLGQPDFLEQGAASLNFLVSVQDDITPSKTINFTTTGQSSTCVWLGDRDIEALIIGKSGKRLEPPFDILNGFGPCDSDGDGVTDDVDTDDDNDGVADAADRFPIDPNESVDTDGDGVGDNADLYPHDATEWKDSDGDGIGDNSDIDKDNDGIPDATETPSEAPIELTSPVYNIPADGGSATHAVDLTALEVEIGDIVTVSNILADGDLDNFNENIYLEFNGGQFSTGGIRTNGRCVEQLIPVDAAISAEVLVSDIGAGVPGLSIYAETNYAVDDLCEFDGVNYQVIVSRPPVMFIDQDEDGVPNMFDLDSDNDGIADVVEAGLVDTDNNFLVDDLLLEQGTVTNPPDSDGDGIPDYLDRESHNPDNDGSQYDIAVSGHAALDTSGDGKIGWEDLGAGVDVDEDGIDALMDIDDTVPGSTFVNTLPTASPMYVATTLNTPVAFALKAVDTDQQLLSYRVTADPDHGQLSGTAPNLTYTPSAGFKGRDSITFVANDGHGDSTAAKINIKVNDPDMRLNSWLDHAGGVTTAGSRVDFSGTPEGWSNNTVRSVALSTLRYEDDYELRITLESDPDGTIFVVGLGVDETTAQWTDVDYALRSSGGRLTIYENGTWRTDGAMLAQGDVLSIHVNAGLIEYRHNGNVVYESTYAGSPDFYVDTSFKTGAVSFDTVVAGIVEAVVVEEPQPPEPRKSSGGGGGTSGLALGLLLLLVGASRRRSALHNFAHS